MFGFRKKGKEIHRRMRRLISVYLDGELDEVRKEELLGHLSACEGCSREIEEQEGVHSYLVDALNPEEVGDIWGTIDDKIFESDKERYKKFIPLFTPIFRPSISYATSALFGIFIGIFLVALSAGLFGTDSYTTSTFAGFNSSYEPSSFEYLEKTPPNSFSALYFGSNMEEIND